MSWDGYFTLDGNEFINAARTEAYAEEAGATWLRPAFNAPHLALMLGDEPYLAPGPDAAPWIDPYEPESHNFFGFYPLDVTGIEDSSRGSTVAESTQDGGVPGRLRHATKTVVFSGVLVGSSEDAVAYGAKWLRRVLLGDECSGQPLNHGFGTNLGFISARPELEVDGTISPEAKLRPMRRTLRRFLVNTGPTVMTRRTVASCGGAVWQVQFTGVAGDPYLYGEEVPILQDWLSAEGGDPWVPGVVPGIIQSGGVAHTEVECGDDTWAPIYDPLCPALVVPPAPPSVPIGCFEAPETWTRRTATLPAENVPKWGVVSPLVTLHSTAVAARNVRLRFYSDPTASLDPSATPCAFDADIVVSYIPAEGTLVFDAASHEVWVETVSGQRRRADSLVFTTEGKPIEWPALSCGIQHILTVDVPVGSTPPVVDVTLVPRVT